MDKDVKISWEKLEPLVKFAEDFILDCFIETGKVTEEHESVWWACIQIREGKRGRVKLYEYLKVRLEGMGLDKCEEKKQINALKAEFGYKNNE